MKKIISLGVVLGLLPSLVFAVTATGTANGTLFGVLAVLNGFLNLVIPVLITIAVIYFIWGIVQYMVGGSDEEAKKAGRSKIINGLIGLFIIIAFWGIIYLVMNTFSVGSSSTPVLPCIPGPGVICR